VRSWVWVVVVAPACGRIGFDASSPSPACALSDGFDYTDTNDPAFQALWDITSQNAQATVTFAAGVMTLDDVNLGLPTGVRIQSRATLSGDCDLTVRVRGETQCSGFAMRGFDVEDITLRGDDGVHFLTWKMPWACAITGDPPQELFSDEAVYWTDPNRDQDWHVVELRFAGATVTSRVDAVDKATFALDLGPFHVELGGTSSATSGYPAATQYDYVMAR
jgi:hypothetical protein